MHIDQHTLLHVLLRDAFHSIPFDSGHLNKNAGNLSQYYTHKHILVVFGIQIRGCFAELLY